MFGATKIKVKSGNVRIKQRPPNRPAEWALVVLIALLVFAGMYMMFKQAVFL